MIPLNPMVPIQYTNGNKAISVMASHPILGNITIDIVGFYDIDELPEIAQHFYDYVIKMYRGLKEQSSENEELDIPDAFKKAFGEDDSEQDEREAV